LLEGLEIVELKLSELQNENWTFRFDSEYFKKIYLKNLECLKNYSNGYLKLSNEIVHMSGGATPLGANYQESGVPFLRVQNIMQNYFSLTDIVFLSKEQDEEIKRSRLKERDVLLTITGVSYGKSTVVSQKLKGANINQHSVKITLSENINPYFLSTFLNSSFGKLQSDKNVIGVTRPALDYQVIRDFTIPKLSILFQNKIEVVIKKSEALTAHSEVAYSQAEQLLLEELGLKDWQPSTENINSKSFKESFLVTGRLDAEYYQPKYEEILNHLQNFSTKKLGDIVDIKKSIEPGSDAYQESGIPFIRVANISKLGITDTDIYLDKSEYQTYELKPKKDTILLSKDGSVGIAYKVEKDLDIITSGALLHLSIIDNNFLPDYLTLVLNSLIVKLQAERDAGGSIIQHWKPSEIEQVIIPLLNTERQQEISSLIQKSFTLKHQSEHLLEIAKRSVEIAIEEDEKKAIEYIKENTIT